MRLNNLRLWATLALLVAATACGGGNAPAQAGPPPGARRVDPATTGTLAGHVTFEGAAPANKPIPLASDPFCQRANPNGASFDTFVVDNGALENVFVYVKDGLGNYAFDIPTEAAALDQKGCIYHPHVMGVRVGQPLELRTSDDTLHNVHALPKVNQEFNFGLEMAGIKKNKTFTAPEVMIEFKCDVHPWMKAYVGA